MDSTGETIKKAVDSVGIGKQTHADEPCSQTDFHENDIQFSVMTESNECDCMGAESKKDELESECRKERICLIKKALDNDELDKAVDYINKFKAEYDDCDAEILELEKTSEKKTVEMELKSYIKTLEYLPKHDYSGRIHILTRILKIDYQNEVLRAEYERCRTAESIPDDEEFPAFKDIDLIKNTLAELHKVSMQDFDKCIALYDVIFKYINYLKLDWIRCGLASSEIKDLEAQLSLLPKHEYKKRIDLYQRLLAVKKNDVYENELHQCEEAILKIEADEALKLKEEYEINQTDILESLKEKLLSKNYISAADDIEKYYNTAKNDVKFNQAALIAVEASKELKSAALEKKLSNFSSDDYTSKISVYRELLELYPTNQEYLNGLFVCEEVLGLHDKYPVLYHHEEFHDAAENNADNSENDFPKLCELVPLPATFDQKTDLMPITDKAVIDKIMNLVDIAALFTDKASNVLGQACAIAEIGIPAVACILPGIGMVSSSCALALCKSFQAGLSKAAKFLNKASAHKEEIAEAAVTLQFVLHTGRHVVSAGDQIMRDLADSAAFKQLKSAVSVASSFVVSRFYMDQSSRDLSEIQNALSKISDFLDNEFRSKIMALCAQVARISQFKGEIIENEELRKKELMKLADYEHECIELTGQANISLERIAQNKSDDYEKYIAVVNDMDKWYLYQDTLMHILANISKLSFVLNQGAVSSEHCYTLYNMYNNRSNKILKQISLYHEEAVKKFEIDIDKSCRKRSGVGGVFAKTLSVFNDDMAYEPISNDDINMIRHQLMSKIENQNEDLDLFNKDVKLVLKNNQLYYYPEIKEEISEINYPELIEILRTTEKSDD